jgi:hypothetical protein
LLTFAHLDVVYCQWLKSVVLKFLRTICGLAEINFSPVQSPVGASKLGKNRTDMPMSGRPDGWVVIV